jgi:hypothetical protein
MAWVALGREVQSTRGIGTAMRLDEVMRSLDAFRDDATLFVRRPWTPASECIVVVVDEEPDAIEQLKPKNLEYFLEIDIIKEVLGVFAGKFPSEDEKLRAVVHYAENDAYPDWIYDR